MPHASAHDAPPTRTTRVMVAAGQASAELGDEVVILSLTEGAYYGMDRVGARIWKLLAAPVTLADVLEALVQEFDVSEQVAWTDLERLMADLIARGLVVRVAP